MKKIYTTLVAVIAITQFSYAQWSTNAAGDAYNNNTSGKVGIGTAVPAGSLLQVNGVTSVRTDVITDGYISINPGGSANQGYINWWKPGGTRVGYLGYTDGISTDNLALTLEASANFIVNGGSVGIGTTDPRGYKLVVNGSAIAESVTVKLHGNWPDYVFKPAYVPPALQQ